MKIFQVRYNQGHYCYYAAEKMELFNQTTNIYKSYTDCKDDKNKIIGHEFTHIKNSLIKYFKEKI